MLARTPEALPARSRALYLSRRGSGGGGETVREGESNERLSLVGDNLNLDN